MNNEIRRSFVDKIKETLYKNGFPEKQVTLPLEKMYQISEEKKLNFNDILEELSLEKIKHRKLTDKILFYQEEDDKEKEHEVYEEDPKVNNDPKAKNYQGLLNKFKNMNLKDFSENPQKILEKLSPEEMNLIQEIYQNLSPQEREELLKRTPSF